MAIKRSVVRMNKKDNIVITRWGNGGISCSLQDVDDTEVELGKDSEPGGYKKPEPTTSVKSPTPKKVIAPSNSQTQNTFKVGDSVSYEGKKWKITRAYIYKDKPYCILDGSKQVSATKLTLSK